jgi:putative transcriptional regulator
MGDVPSQMDNRMIYRVSALAMILVVLGLLLVRPEAAPQNGSTPPNVGGLAGQFLVASEEMGDPRFVQSVILMIHHDAGGAMGIIVNRPLGEVPTGKLLESMGLDGTGTRDTVRLHYGGPVEPRKGLTVHTTDYTAEGTMRIVGGIAVTGNPEILRAIGAGKGPKRYLIALGYAGWAPGQLESEMKAGGWFTIPADDALTFNENHEKTWERAKARRRIDL